MATLNGQPINTSFNGLIKTTDNGIIGATKKVITDGLGNESTLSLGTDSASFTGDLDLTNATVTGLPDAGVQSVVAGTNVTVDNTDPLNPIVSATDTGIQSVVAGTNVTVDNTDPLNPIVSATGGGGGGSDFAEGQAITPYLASNVYSIPWILSGYTQATAKPFLFANSLQLIPFYANAGEAIGEFYFRVTTAVSGALMNVGLYKSYVSDTAGFKTTMPEFVTTIANDVDVSTAGKKSFTGLNITLPTDAVGGCYWIGFQSSESNVRLTRWSNWVAAERVIYSDIYRGNGIEITRPDFTLPSGQIDLSTITVGPSTDLSIDFGWRYKA